MTVLQLTRKVYHFSISPLMVKSIFLAFLAFLVIHPGELGDLSRGAMIDAYLTVSIFVALTFFLIISLEKVFKFDLGEFNATHPKLQVMVSACLGALPGCGGAIIVLTQYVKKQVSFGAVVAALTATMGDAAFLLIAAEPITGLAIIAVSLVIGSLSGWIVDVIHGREFLQKYTHQFSDRDDDTYPRDSFTQRLYQFLTRSWWWILVPGAIYGIAEAFQMDTENWFHIGSISFREILGLSGALLTIVIWRLGIYHSRCSEHQHEASEKLDKRIIHDTSFITLWVAVGFLVYELAVYAFGLDLKSLLKDVSLYLPLFAVLIGFIPGCGPQILITTMYINGIIPLSAQLGNAISNDGDALFPAIAHSPYAAIIATLYSAIPAILLAYGYYFFIE